MKKVAIDVIFAEVHMMVVGEYVPADERGGAEIENLKILIGGQDVYHLLSNNQIEQIHLLALESCGGG